MLDVLDVNHGDALVIPLEPHDAPDDSTQAQPAQVEEDDFPKPRRQRPEAWKKNIVKAKNNSGEAHTSMRGVQKAAREMKNGCSPKCKRKCHFNVTDDQRKKIFDQFWGLKDHTLQWCFIGNSVTEVKVKRRTTITLHGTEPFRHSSYLYHFTLERTNDLQVCKQMYLNTLGIGDKWVRTAIKKKRDNSGAISVDGRGRTKRPNPERIAMKNDVIAHIKSFPTVESHYCRKDCKARFLPENLSRRKMWSMYKIEISSKQPTLENGDAAKPRLIASLRVYRKIFREEFNIKFLRPKKDQCPKCLSWKNKTNEEKTEQASTLYEKHLSDKRIAQDLKTADIDRIKSNPDPTECVLTCDLEKVFLCPKGENAEFFYKSKLSCYNFTIFVSGAQKGHCFVWDQTEAGRGSAEISSCLWKFFVIYVGKGVKVFIIYSDNCSGQNKNQFLFAMYVLASIRFGIKIIHRYLEVGHTHMECDSVHATIQNSIKNQEIFVPAQWYAAIKIAKKKLPLYDVIELKQEDVFDFTPLAALQNWGKLRTSQFKEICVDGNEPGVVCFKNEYAEALQSVNVLKRGPGRPVNYMTFPLQKRYNAKIPLRPIQIKHFKELCKSGAIPTAHHPFYMNMLPAIQQQAQPPPPPDEVSDVESLSDAPDSDSDDGDLDADDDGDYEDDDREFDEIEASDSE